MFYYLLVVILFYSLYQHPLLSRILPSILPLESSPCQTPTHNTRLSQQRKGRYRPRPGQKNHPGDGKKEGSGKGTPHEDNEGTYPKGREEKRKEKKRGKENGDRRGRDNKQHPRKYFLKNKRTKEQKDGRLKEGEILLWEKQRTEHAIFTE
ncbi:MAG: hypothetical protein K2N13_01370 [Paraprevotella sp.]|nr:hypothetical protein [Paraprevotella sp.]